MIKKINPGERDFAQKIYALFQASYLVEAKLLEVDDFPPLKRTVKDIMNSGTKFYAFWKAGEMAALIEIKQELDCTDICSLVVHPKYFRQSLGSQLVSFVLDSFDLTICTVETGLKNIPAIKLYEKLGFEEVEQWDLAAGIRKVKFKKAKCNEKVIERN